MWAVGGKGADFVAETHEHYWRIGHGDARAAVFAEIVESGYLVHGSVPPGRPVRDERNPMEVQQKADRRPAPCEDFVLPLLSSDGNPTA
jgi:hypothetical protein